MRSGRSSFAPALEVRESLPTMSLLFVDEGQRKEPALRRLSLFHAGGFSGPVAVEDRPSGVYRARIQPSCSVVIPAAMVNHGRAINPGFFFKRVLPRAALRDDAEFLLGWTSLSAKSRKDGRAWSEAWRRFRDSR